MRLDELFEKRTLAASKLKTIMRERGFYKASFCKKTDISYARQDLEC